MASLTTGLILTILIQCFIIKHTSVNKRDEIHTFIIVNNHECPTDHWYVVVRVITNQSRLRDLCSRNGPKVTLTYFSMFLITLSNDVNINPVPSTSLYPCGTCDKPVRYDGTLLYDDFIVNIYIQLDWEQVFNNLLVPLHTNTLIA